MRKDKLSNALRGIVGNEQSPVEAHTPDLINTIDDEQLRLALHAKRMDGRGRPRKNTDTTGKRTDGYSRTSLIVNDELWAKIREVSFRETLTMKEIVNLALQMVVERYEAKHGVIQPQTERQATDINKVF